MRKTPTASYAIALASEHNIKIKTTASDNAAKTFSRLSDSNPTNDPINDLIHTLIREKVISKAEGLNLIAQHIIEKRKEF